MIDCMNDEQDSSEDEKNLFFGGFCLHLAITSAAAGFDLCLTVCGVCGVSNEFKEEESRRV